MAARTNDRLLCEQHVVPDDRIGHSIDGPPRVQMGPGKKPSRVLRHNLKSIRPDTRPDSDGEVIKAGHVSLTKIDIREIGRMG